MNDFRLWISAAGAFAITVAAVIGLRPIAYAVDLLDRPGGHKTHHGAVPVVGGLGMLLGLVFGLGSYSGALGSLQPYVFSCVLLAVVGLLDDRFNLAPTLRLIAQFTAVLPMFFAAAVRVTSLGNLFGAGPIDVSGASLLATAVVAMGAINAFNMLDGLDGLAGGIALVAAILMLFLPGIASLPGSVLLLVVLAACIGGFLVFNIPVQWNRGIRCFMGDGGSTVLGFSIAWLMIGACEGSARVTAPVTMVWLVAVPASDLVWTVLRRLLRGQSPIRPDNEHMHHMLLRAGLGVRAVFTVMIGAATLCGAIGLYLERTSVPETLSFILLVLACFTLVAIGRRASTLVGLLPEWILRSAFIRDRRVAP